MLTVGVDVGGTFTDFVLFNDETQELQTHKVASTPDDATRAFMEGLRQLNVNLGQVGRIIHGTTVATNAVLERKGATTALITTKGFKDVIEFGQLRRYPYKGLWNTKWSRIPPLVPPYLRLEVPERILSNGKVLVKLKAEDILALAEQLKKQQIEALAVCFINSYLNRSHEQQAGGLLRKVLPGVAISLSVETIPEIHEFERWSTTVLNAYITPQLKNYLDQLSRYLHDGGYKGEIFYMVSSGGVVTEKSATEYPVKFILSGPAGGVNTGVFISEVTRLRDIITYDMGGTSTDVCLIRDSQPTISTEKIFSGIPIRTPTMDITTIGAGGGSIVWVDREGALMVGPQSAGASPGPASYGLGGTEFTITDANLLLGRIGVATLLGGARRLHLELAVKAIKRIAQRVDVPDIYRLADGVIKICVVNMGTAIRALSVEKGQDPRSLVLVPMGGAGPMHAIPVASELGIRKILVPKYPGNASAFGLLVSDLKHDYVRTYVTELSKADLPRIRGLWKEMADEGRQILLKEGVRADMINVSYSAEMRYLSQFWRVDTPAAHDFEISDMAEAFHSQYHNIYGYSREAVEVELVNLRVIASGLVARPAAHRYESQTRLLSEAMKEERKVYFEADFVDCPVYERELLPQGSSIDGPAIVEEFGATTVIFPEWKATLDDFGNFILEPKGVLVR